LAIPGKIRAVSTAKTQSTVSNQSVGPSDRPSQPTAPNKPVGFQSAQGLFANYKLEDKGGYITREFKDYGYRLAIELGDLPHKSLYIKMAKQIERGILEKALSFVADSQADSKARLFMWKVKQLREEAKTKTETQLKNKKKS